MPKESSVYIMIEKKRKLTVYEKPYCLLRQWKKTKILYFLLIFENVLGMYMLKTSIYIHVENKRKLRITRNILSVCRFFRMYLIAITLTCA